MNTAELTGLLIQQNHIGSVIKVSGAVVRALIKLVLVPSQSLLIRSKQARSLNRQEACWMKGDCWEGHSSETGSSSAVIQAVAMGSERCGLIQKAFGRWGWATGKKSRATPKSAQATAARMIRSGGESEFGFDLPVIHAGEVVSSSWRRASAAGKR